MRQLINNYKLLLHIFFISVLLVIIPSFASAYSVNGVVEFTYNHYQTKVGDTTTSGSSFVEHYQASFDSFVYDPRFLRYTLGAGYNRTHSKESSDSNSLTYNANFSFFPGRTVSWDVFGSKTTVHVDNPQSVAGYDVDMTTYGGSLDLRLTMLRNGRTRNNNFNTNNNNNNTNNNRNRRGLFIFPLPDLQFSFNHQEAESRNQSNPTKEERDLRHASMRYRINSSFTLNADMTDENFKNLHDSSSYQNKTLNFDSTYTISSRSDLKMTGRMTERESDNISGFKDPTYKTWAYNAVLNFKEVNNIEQVYRYDFFKTIGGAVVSTSQSGMAGIRYRILPELRLTADARYRESDYHRTATLLLTEESSNVRDGSLFVGAAYDKVYAPEFLDPFALHTVYDFRTGFNDVTSSVSTQNGSGWYYENVVNLGLNSVGWKQDSLSFDYIYSSKRDNSPINNDIWINNYRIGMATNRVPKTKISAAATYSVTNQNNNDTSFFYPSQNEIKQTSRSLTYSASVDHTPISFLTLNAGASRQKTKASTNYALTTIQSDYDVIETMVYGSANTNFIVSRNMSVFGLVREEFRRHSDGFTTDTYVYNAAAGMNYRIRKIIINTEWRWREDVKHEQPRVQQQYFMVKVSRPF